MASPVYQHLVTAYLLLALQPHSRLLPAAAADVKEVRLGKAPEAAQADSWVPICRPEDLPKGETTGLDTLQRCLADAACLVRTEPLLDLHVYDVRFMVVVMVYDNLGCVDYSRPLPVGPRPLADINPPPRRRAQGG